MKLKMRWEWIEEGYLKRAPIMGGWLIYAVEDVVHEREVDGLLVPGWDYRPALTFVPDPLHSWKIEDWCRTIEEQK